MFSLSSASLPVLRPVQALGEHLVVSRLEMADRARSEVIVNHAAVVGPPTERSPALCQHGRHDVVPDKEKTRGGWREQRELAEDVREKYDRVVRHKGAAGMAAIDGRSCGGCHQQITTNQLSELLGGRIVTCRSCGRLLYTPESASPA